MSDTPLQPREKVFAIVFALVVTALLVEAGFRLLGPKQLAFNNMAAEYPSNPRDYFEEIRTENGQPVYGVPMDERVGLGGRADATPTAPVRILGLGDSQAQGQGVYVQDTMYEKLAKKLAENDIAIRIRNAAVKGYDLDEIAARYAYEARDAGRYDVVLYTMVLDDFGLDRSELDRLQSPSVSADEAGWRARSATWDFAAHIAAQVKLSEQTTAAYLNSYRGNNLALRTEQLKRFAEQVRADGAELVVIVLPLLYDFKTYPFGPIHTTMVEMGKTHSIEVLDMLPSFQGMNASELWVHAVDHHPNEVAHNHIADTVFHHLEKNGHLKSLTPEKNQSE